MEDIVIKFRKHTKHELDQKIIELKTEFYKQLLDKADCSLKRAAAIYQGPGIRAMGDLLKRYGLDTYKERLKQDSTFYFDSIQSIKIDM